MPSLRGRHHETRDLVEALDPMHLPAHLEPVARPISDLALKMVARFPDGPELTAGLAKLAEALVCFIHAAHQPPATTRR